MARRRFEHLLRDDLWDGPVRRTSTHPSARKGLLGSGRVVAGRSCPRVAFEGSRKWSGIATQLHKRRATKRERPRSILLNSVGAPSGASRLYAPECGMSNSRNFRVRRRAEFTPSPSPKGCCSVCLDNEPLAVHEPVGARVGALLDHVDAGPQSTRSATPCRPWTDIGSNVSVGHGRIAGWVSRCGGRGGVESF
jgi:hypothetical protein